MLRKSFVKASAACLAGLLFVTGCSSAITQPTTETSETAQASTAASAGASTMASTAASTATSEGVKTKYPLTVPIYDADGKMVNMTFDSAPQRVVSTQLSMTELLINLGLEDKIVGVFSNDNKIEGKMGDQIAELNNLGDKKSVSKEAIIALEPDLIVGKVPSMFTDTSIGTVEFYQGMGVNVYTELASAKIDQSLENIIQDVKNIGMIFDVSDAADKYAEELQTQLADVLSKVQSKAGSKPLKVLFMAGYHDGTFSGFSSSLHAQMLKAVDAVNVLDHGGNGFSMENLIELNPDAIIYVLADRNSETDKTAVKDLLSNETVQSVKAIADKKVITVKYDDVMDYGAGVITSIGTLYQGLYE